MINQQFATEEEEIYTHSIGSKFVNHREGLLSEIIEASQFMQESSTEKGKMTFYFIEACRGADNLEELKLVRTLSDAQRDPHRNAKSLVNINPIANVNKSQKIGVFMGPSFSKGSADYNYGALKKSLADDIELRQKYQALPYWKRFNKLQEVTDLLSPFLHKKIIVNEILLSNQDQLSKISTDVFASYPVLVYGCKENASQPTSTLWRLPHTIEIDHLS